MLVAIEGCQAWSDVMSLIGASAILYTNLGRPWVGKHNNFFVVGTPLSAFGQPKRSENKLAHANDVCSAEVIKIEHPTRGDDTRAWGPPYAKHVRGKGTKSDGESAYFLSVSRTRSAWLWPLTDFFDRLIETRNP